MEEDEDVLVPAVEPEADPEIEVGDDDDEGAEASAAPEKADPARPSRRERRGNRVNELLEAERRRADAAEARHAEAMRTMQSALSRPVYAQPVQPQQQGPDPFEVEAHQLRQQQTTLTRAFQDAVARGDQAAVEQYEQQAWALREKMDDNAYIRRARKWGVPQQQQQPQMSPQQIEHMVEAAAVRRRFQEEHPDILSDETAAGVFQANFSKRLKKREPDNWETLCKAADETRSELRMKPRGGKPAPSAATRSRLAGMGAGVSGAGSQGPKVVKMDSFNRKLAIAAFPHLPEAQAYQKWAREAGAKVP